MKLLKMFAELTLGRVIILAIFVTAGYYFNNFDSGESIEKIIADTETTVATEEARRAEISKTMKKEEEMRGNVLQLQRNLDVVKSKIPSDLKEIDVQSIINQAAVSSGVSINDLKSVIDSNRDANAPPRQMSINEIKPENLIDEVRFKVQLTATFDSFINFLKFIADESKIIKLRNFTIKRMSENVDEDRVVFQGEVVGFKQANIQIIQGSK